MSEELRTGHWLVAKYYKEIQFLKGQIEQLREELSKYTGDGEE